MPCLKSRHILFVIGLMFHFPFVLQQATAAQVEYEFYAGFTGPIDNLRSDQDAGGIPAWTGAISALDWRAWQLTYGLRVRGYIQPTATGNYTFWMSADDQGRFYLSTDSRPENMSLLSSVPGYTGRYEYDKYPEQQSVIVSLIANQKYYFEALVKQGVHDEYFTVAWAGPGFTQQVIGTSYLKPYHIGGVLWEKWNGTDATLSSLYNHADYPEKPAEWGYLNRLAAPVNVGSNYGMRLRGYVIPPLTGNYTFWIASDNEGELYLSSDEWPAHKQLIANVPGLTGNGEWTKYPQQQSLPIHLEKGQKYYIEALMSEGAGDDNLAVAWQPPGLSQTIIGGRYLEAYRVVRPVLHYLASAVQPADLDENNGVMQMRDLSLNGNDSILEQEVTRRPEYMIGSDGFPSLFFDGSNDRLEAAAPLDDIQQFTFSCWSKLTQEVRPAGILFSGYGAATMQVNNSQSNQLSVGVSTPGQFTPHTGSSLEQWLHLTVTWDGKKVVVYRNGQIWTTFASTGPKDMNGIITFGNWWRDTYYSYPLLGYMDDIRIYDIALTQEEVREIMHFRKLRAHWKLDESSPTLAEDASGWGHEGQVYGSVDSVEAPNAKGYELNASGEYLEIFSPTGEELDLGQSSFALSFWFRTAGSGGRILGKGHHGWGAGYLAAMGNNAAGSLDAGLGGSGQSGSTLFSAVNPVNDDVWHHAVMTFNRGTERAKIYVDGQAQSLVKYSGTAGVLIDGGKTLDMSNGNQLSATDIYGRPLAIGAWVGTSGVFGGAQFLGSLDDVRIYEAVLTDADVAALYSNGFYNDSDGDGLSDFWELNWLGSLAQDGTANLDSDLWTNAEEYRRNSDPATSSSGHTSIIYVNANLGSDARTGYAPTPTPHDGPKATIGLASGGISAAYDGDTIQIAAGTYDLESAWSTDGKSLVLKPQGTVVIKP